VMMEKGTMRVLLIEDNSGEARLIQEMLANSPALAFDVVWAASLQVGLERLSQEHFDIALLDLGLEDSQGLTTLKKVHEKNQEIPVIIVTTLVDEMVGVQAVQLGAQDHLLKQQLTAPLLIRSLQYAFERKNSERLMRESEERFRTLTAMSPSGVFFTDQKGKYIYVNQAWLDMAGMAFQDVLGDGWTRALFSDDRASSITAWNDFISGQGVWNREYRLSVPGGKLVWVYSKAVALRDTQGVITGYLGANTDITERKLVESALRKQRDRTQRYLDISGNVIIVLDCQGAVTLVNKKGCEIFGHKEEEIVGKNWFDLYVPAEYREQIQGQFRQFISGNFKDNEYFDVEIINAHGEYKILSLHNISLYNDAGLIVGVLSSGEDVTERRRLEQEKTSRSEQIIRHQGALLALAKESGTDLAKVIERVIEVAAKTLHAQRASVGFFDNAHQTLMYDDVFEVSNNRHVSGERLSVAEFPLYFKAFEENRVIAAHDSFLDSRTSQLHDAYLQPRGITSLLDVPIRLHGKVVGVVSIGHVGEKRFWLEEEQNFAASLADYIALSMETLERRETEDALRKSEGRLWTVFESAKDVAFIVTDYVGAHSRILEFSAGAQVIFGYTRQEVIGSPVSVLQFPNEFLDEQEFREKQSVISREVLLERNGKGRFPASCSVYTLVDAQGQPYGLLWVVLDLTERKRFEERLKKINECFLRFVPDPLENIERLTILCGDVLEADMVLYNRLENGKLYAMGQWNVPDDFSAVSDAKGHICSDVIAHSGEEIRLLRNLPETEYAATDPAIARYHLKTYMGHVVKDRGKAVGSLCALFTRDVSPGEFDIKTMGILSAAIGIEEERRGMIISLRKSELNYRELVEGANSIILRMDTNGVVIFLNEFAQRFFGFRAEEIIGQNVVGTIVPETDTGGRNLRGMIEDIGKNPERYAANENENIRKDGTRVTVAWTNRVLFDKEGHVSEILCVGNDITELKNAREHIQEQYLFLQRLMDTIPNPIFYKDLHGVYLGCNEAYGRFLGKSCAEIIGKTVFDIMPENLARTHTDLDTQLFDNPGLQVNEEDVLDSDGARRHVYFNKATFNNRYGMVAGLVGVIIDVSDIKAAQEELRKSKEFLGSIINTIGDPIFVKDEAHRFMIVNDAECTLIGKPREEIIGRTDADFFPLEQVAVFWENDNFVMVTGVTNENEENITDKEGQTHIILTKKALHRDPTSGKKLLVGVIRDITDRKKAEQDVTRSYAVQNTVNALLRLSLEDASLEEILSQALHLILEADWIAQEKKGVIFLIEDDPDTLVMKAQVGLSEQRQHLCSRIRKGFCYCGCAALEEKLEFTSCVDTKHEAVYDGMPGHGHYCAPIIAGQRLIGVLNVYVSEGAQRTTATDAFMNAIATTLSGVIQRKRAEFELKNAYQRLRETQSQLIHAEKMQVVGTLASGIAHEVKNPLGIIIQGVGFLEKEPGTNRGTSGEVLMMIKEAVERANRIIHGLLDFTRSSPIEFKPQEIQEVLETSLMLVQKQLVLKNIKIIRDYQESQRVVRADKHQLEQVFVNVILNAFQAMPKGGILTVRTFNKTFIQLQEGMGRRATDFLHPGDSALVVEIEDTGSGVQPELINKIFDPFFTTKPPGQGVGLGLSICRSIIDSHGGLMTMESAPGKGAKIVIMLPVFLEKRQLV